MGIVMNPAFADFVNSQLNNVGYAIRGWMRVDGESVGLPQAVPNDRKMDYWFRDFYMVMVTAFITELAYRVGDQAYVVPNSLELLGLKKLKEFYTPDNIHTPNFAKSMAIKNATREFPAILRGHMLGSLINPRSYYSVPDLLDSQGIPDLIKDKVRKLPIPEADKWVGEYRTSMTPYQYVKKFLEDTKDIKDPKVQALRAEVKDARLWSHHLRRILNPQQYIDKFLLPKGKITAKEAEVLKEQMSKLEDLTKLFEKARDSASSTDIYNHMKRTGRLGFLDPKLGEKEFTRVLKGSSWFDLLADIRQRGFHEGLLHYQKLQGYHRHPLIPVFREEPRMANLKELFGKLKAMAKEPIFKDSKFLQQFNNGLTEQKFADMLKPPPMSELVKQYKQHGFKQAANFYRSNSTFTKPDELMNFVRRELMLPMARHEFKAKPVMSGLIDDLLHSKVIQRQLFKVSEGARFWIKLPASLLFLFVFFGLAANSIDAKYLQPYQKKIVQQRGDINEFVIPGFVGTIPGIAVFMGMMKLPFIQRMGYVNSFLAAGLAGLAAFGASSFALFKAKISQPRGEQPTGGGTSQVLRSVLKPSGPPAAKSLYRMADMRSNTFAMPQQRPYQPPGSGNVFIT